MKTLTVEKLMELLEKYPDQNAKVVLEGCDCASDCVGISFGEGAYKGEIILRTKNGVFQIDELKMIKRVPK